jgi:hypothetical protein
MERRNNANRRQISASYVLERAASSSNLVLCLVYASKLKTEVTCFAENLEDI